MDVEQLHAHIVRLEKMAKTKVPVAEVVCRMNWVGEQLSITVHVAERGDANSTWSREKEFTGEPNEAERVVREVELFVYNIPDERERAIEMLTHHLTEIAAKLPKSDNDIAAKAWAEIHNLLMEKVKSISKNGLPSPDRVSSLKIV